MPVAVAFKPFSQRAIVQVWQKAFHNATINVISTDVTSIVSGVNIGCYINIRRSGIPFARLSIIKGIIQEFDIYNYNCIVKRG
jgi:hypothetical protein